MSEMKRRIQKVKYCLLFLGIFSIVILSLNECHLSVGVITDGDFKTITVDVAEELIENSTDLFILDVRTNSEFKAGHISGAFLIPHTDINDSQDELPVNKSHPILVYCRSGVRSAIASTTLVSLSYNSTYNMAGGFTAWKNAGYPYINSATTGSASFIMLPVLVLMIIRFKKRS
ncbi:MAG: rhodanese-like domain-containing protein [Candidatus Hodarchaeales archaeon]|jgi:rhodanese-related sulfurtransferase